MKKTLLLSAFILAGFFSTFNSQAQLDGSGNAPDFTVEDLDGIRHHLYEYLDSGKVVVIDLFAVWCSICQSNTPVLESIYEKYGPEGNGMIEMLSLEADDNTSDEQVLDFVESFSATNPHINETGNVASLFQLLGFPLYYVVAPDRSYKVFPGTQMNLEDELSGAIENSPSLREIENDIRITRFTEPAGTYCNEAVFPSIEFQNYGINEITELVIDLYLDGSLYYSYYHTDTLHPYEYAGAVLNEIQGLEHGWHEVGFEVSSVNNETDADDNDWIEPAYFLFLEESIQADVFLTTDTYPKETYWQIREDGKTASQRLSFGQGRTTYHDSVCLEEGHCYTFTVFDRYGDGIRQGGVSLIYKGDTLVNIDAGAFNKDSVSVNFCIGNASSVFNPLSANKPDVNIYPNPASENIILELPSDIKGPVELRITNMTGQTIHFENLSNPITKKSINLSAFSDGIIFLRIALENQSITKKILIQK